MSLAIERVVVQVASADKRKIEAKAKRLDITLSELMRRASFSYTSEAEDVELGVIADAANKAAKNAIAYIDDALSFIHASNLRLASMEKKAIAKKGH